MSGWPLEFVRVGSAETSTWEVDTYSTGRLKLTATAAAMVSAVRRRIIQKYVRMNPRDPRRFGEYRLIGPLLSV
jgi:uncharacterized protein (UPF0548 family)